MPGIFFTKEQLHNLSHWTYSIVDKSNTTQVLTPLWDYLVTLVPNTVAPNVLSLTGLLCILYSFHLSYHYITIYPNLIAFFIFILVFAYMNLDAIDGKHARRTNNASPLGELFDHSCVNIGVVFLTMTMTHIYNIESPLIQWYLV